MIDDPSALTFVSNYCLIPFLSHTSSTPPPSQTTAAIMYSKLMRLLAKAHVTFSSTLCVQYGKGNEGSTVRFGQFNFRASVAPALAMQSISMEDLMDDSGRDGDGDGDGAKREDSSGSGATDEGGFPVIEFRMVNDRANHEGSEIWDAQIRGILQVKKDVNPSNATNSKAAGGESTLDLDKKAYYQFALTPDSHPHFSRIWYARHVLNAESPLLKREIRDMIVQDGNKWDKGEWNAIARMIVIALIDCTHHHSHHTHLSRFSCRFQYCIRDSTVY